MAIKSKNKVVYTTDGIPYLWGSGDVTTAPSGEVKITASDAAASDLFGYTVAVGSGRIIIGAPLDDDNGASSGSAYIFDLDGNQLAKITASDGAAGDQFGYTVAVGSGRIIIGAPLDDDNGASSGSAYIFDLDGNQLAKITASDGAAGDQFGLSVSVGSGRIVVGAPYSNSSTGAGYIFDLDGNQITKITSSDGAANDYFGFSVFASSSIIVIGAYTTNSYAGAAYIFNLDGNQITKLVADDATTGDYFGRSVAVGSGRIAVGAPGDADNGAVSGSTYIFDLDGNQLAKITVSDGAAGDWFGYSVSVGSGRIVVGAYGDSDNGSASGSAYIFDLDGNQLDKITASDGAAGDIFGGSVFVGLGRIVIGSYQDDDNGDSSGSAYIYETPQVYNLYDAIELKGQI